MNKEILRLAIPNILSNISVPLLSSVDTALMGRMDSAAYIGAVGLGSMIFNFVYWSFGFLRMGTTGLTAQAYGEKDDAKIINTFGRAALFGLGSALLLVLFQYPIGEACIYLSGASGETEDLVRQYFYIRIWAAPATLTAFAILGWFFGMQNAIYPLILTMFINVVNIVANIICINYLGMDVDGVAWGTVIAQYSGIFLAAALIYFKYKNLLPEWDLQKIFDWGKMKAFLQLNMDIFIRTFFLIFAFGFFYNRSAAEGVMMLAVNQVYMQYINWMSYAVDGFAYASESLIGKYKGAKDNIALKKAIRLTFLWGMGGAVFFTILYGLGGSYLLRIFTDQEAVIQAAMPFLIWMIVFPIIATPCYIWDGIYIGLTASKAMRNTMFIAFGVYILGYFVFLPFGNHGLWAALLIYMGARGLVQWWWYRNGKVV